MHLPFPGELRLAPATAQSPLSVFLVSPSLFSFALLPDPAPLAHSLAGSLTRSLTLASVLFHCGSGTQKHTHTHTVLYTQTYANNTDANTKNSCQRIYVEFVGLLPVTW